MVKDTTKAKADKPKRTVLTPQQRVEKLEAELAAARERAAKRANAGRTKALEKRAKLVEKRDTLNAQIAAIDAEYPDEETTVVTESGQDSSES